MCVCGVTCVVTWGISMEDNEIGKCVSDEVWDSMKDGMEDSVWDSVCSRVLGRVWDRMETRVWGRAGGGVWSRIDSYMETKYGR